MDQPCAGSVEPLDAGLRRYSLTFRTKNRRHAFTSLEAVTTVYEQIRRAAAENHFAILAYCFMPDHVHLLAEATSRSANWPRFVARAKQYTGYYYSRAFGGRRLWQRHGFERVLRGDDDVRAIARHIVSNPIRAGLARHVEDYPFSGSDVYSIGQAGVSPGRAPQSGGVTEAQRAAERTQEQEPAASVVPGEPSRAVRYNCGSHENCRRDRQTALGARNPRAEPE